MYGTEVAVYIKIKVKCVPLNFNVLTIENSGITIIIPGIPSAVIILFLIKPLNLNLNLVRQYAAGALTIIVRIHEGTV